MTDTEKTEGVKFYVLNNDRQTANVILECENDGMKNGGPYYVAKIMCTLL